MTQREFVIVATLVFWFWFAIWKRGDLYNVAVKLSFLGLALCGSWILLNR